MNITVQKTHSFKHDTDTPMMSSVIANCPDSCPRYFGQMYASDSDFAPIISLHGL